MKIHNCHQGDVRWHDIRSKCFTASELGQWAVEPVKVTLNVDEIKRMLDQFEIPRKGITKREDLLALLPEPERFAELCDGARTAILSKIKQGRLLSLMGRTFNEIGTEESIWLAREEELAAKSEKAFEYNIPVKYGKLLEPHARAFYERKTGFVVTEIGFIEHDSGGFGCSPDGLIYTPTPDHKLITGNNTLHGVEIKCPIPETHLEWLLDGVLPECHKLQVHACMAVTGLDTWDFFSHCPGEAPLLVTVERDDFTDQLEAGLKTLVLEKAKMMAKLSGLWRAEFGEVTP